MGLREKLIFGANFFFDGKYIDTCIYSLLAQEWKNDLTIFFALYVQILLPAGSSARSRYLKKQLPPDN
jgi:hypothetical protein